jgi:DNA-binding HxlR family transcriptional regulator
MYERTTELIQRKWTLDILELLSEQGALNYTLIADEIPASSDTLSKHLDLVCERDLVERTEHSARNVRYEVTDRGEDVLRHIRILEDILNS